MPFIQAVAQDAFAEAGRRVDEWLSTRWYISQDEEHLFKDWLGYFFTPKRIDPEIDDLPTLDELNSSEQLRVSTFGVPESALPMQVSQPQMPVIPSFSLPPPTPPAISETDLVDRVALAVLAKLQAATYMPPRAQVSASGEMRSLGEVLGPVQRAVRRFGG